MRMLNVNSYFFLNNFREFRTFDLLSSVSCHHKVSSAGQCYSSVGIRDSFGMDSPSEKSFFDDMPWELFSMILKLLPGAVLVKSRAINQFWRKECTRLLFDRMAKLLCELYDLKEKLWRQKQDVENDPQADDVLDANFVFVFWLHLKLENALKVFYHEETHPNAPFLYGTVSKKSLVT